MERKRVLVGMSGGVDSAAAVILLQEAGYEAVGCTLRMLGNSETENGVEDARAAAGRLGIDFCVLQVQDLFREKVVRNFIDFYQSGRTPNPCIQCNRYVKFDALLRKADELEIPFVATGHYARVDYDASVGRWRLLRGLDRRKDQSYVLCPLSQRHLSRLLLPVGQYGKAEIRALAKQYGLENAHKPDSQDICFIPDGDYSAFLSQSGAELVPGDFVDSSGLTLGRHKGLACYTVGQRRGLGVSAGRPL